MSQNFMAALIALWMFGDPAMNALEIRTKFVEQSGYRSLVTDAPNSDYSDNGADYFLNAGLRWLERRLEGWAQRRKYVVNIASGDYTLNVPDINNIRRFRVRDSENKTYPVQFRTLDQLRAIYSTTDFGDIEAGRPLYWTWNQEGVETQNAIVDPNFDLAEGTLNPDTSGPDLSGKWTENTEPGVTWTISGGAATLSCTPADAGDNSIANYGSLMATFPGIGTPERTEVSILMTSYTGAFAGFRILVGWTGYLDGDWVLSSAGGADIYLGQHSAITGYQGPLETNKTFTVTLDTYSWFQTNGYPINYIEIVPLFVQNGDASTVVLTSVELRTATNTGGNVLITPPADADYTADIWGSFKKNELVSDGDTNWWTDTHPELVVRAARLQLEMDGHRNISGVNAFQKQLEEELERLAMEHSYAWVAGMTPQETVPNG